MKTAFSVVVVEMITTFMEDRCADRQEMGVATRITIGWQRSTTHYRQESKKC